MKQETMGWQWHWLNQMQIIYTSLPIDNHNSTAPLQSIFTGQMLLLTFHQQCQSIGDRYMQNIVLKSNISQCVDTIGSETGKACCL